MPKNLGLSVVDGWSDTLANTTILERNNVKHIIISTTQLFSQCLH
jgi:hypothetical protein